MIMGTVLNMVLSMIPGTILKMILKTILDKIVKMILNTILDMILDMIMNKILDKNSLYLADLDIHEAVVVGHHLLSVLTHGELLQEIEVVRSECLPVLQRSDHLAIHDHGLGPGLGLQDRPGKQSVALKHLLGQVLGGFGQGAHIRSY